ncbi:MAG: phosphate acyltransferase PlsX [Eubacteriales bacterium]
MRVILDAMGGDNAPLEIIRGALLALQAYDIDITLIGSLDEIKRVADENQISLVHDRLELVNTTEVITMEDQALSVRSKKDSSMAVGLRMLSEGNGDAFVCAGNTGALYAGGSLIVGRVKGYRKAAIATILPFACPIIMIDSGANIVVTDENLEQFAIMGSIYMNKIFGIEAPRVGLLNNGSEPTKGTQVMQEAYVRLSECKAINFVGNIESKELTKGPCDVIVTDGFTGNIVLKMVEGLGSFLLGKLKAIFYKNMLTKLSAAMIKKDMAALKHDFDSSAYGGAPILGISKPVIKAHGSSDARAIQNAVRQAIDYHSTGIIYEIARNVKKPEDAAHNADAQSAPAAALSDDTADKTQNGTPADECSGSGEGECK